MRWRRKTAVAAAVLVVSAGLGAAAPADAVTDSGTGAGRSVEPLGPPVGGPQGGGRGSVFSPGGVRGHLPGVPTAARARTELSHLTVAPYKDDGSYHRDAFGNGWPVVNGCTVRELVLIRDRAAGKPNGCTVDGGKWFSDYDGLTLTSPSKLDIDHMVPLKDAWFSGARTWTPDKRKQFHNDMARPQLLAVSAASNRSKGDKAPEEWMPPRLAYHCTYAKAWVHVKSHYKLAVTKAEKNKLTNELKAPCK